MPEPTTPSTTPYTIPHYFYAAMHSLGFNQVGVRKVRECIHTIGITSPPHVKQAERAFCQLTAGLRIYVWVTTSPNTKERGIVVVCSERDGVHLRRIAATRHNGWANVLTAVKKVIGEVEDRPTCQKCSVLHRIVGDVESKTIEWKCPNHRAHRTYPVEMPTKQSVSA